MTNFINKLLNKSNQPNQNTVSSSSSNLPNINVSNPLPVIPPHGNDVVVSPQQSIPDDVVERVVLSEHGFNLAARSGGDAALLRSSLNRIYHGHLVDVNQNENDHLLLKQHREKEMAELDKNLADLEAERNNVINNKIPLKEQELNNEKHKIHDLKINNAEQQLLSEYNRFWFIAYVVISIVVGLFLIFFYANVIFNALLRNILLDVVGSSTTDIGLLLNAFFSDKIFDQKPFFIFFSFLSGFIFFGFGLLPHKLKNDKRIKSNYLRWFLVIICLLVAMLAEGLLAAKIHKNIEIVKGLVLPDEEYKPEIWYQSDMFWIIVIFGFGVYMFWGYILELAVDMHSKKDNGKVVKLHIDKINEIIAFINKEIAELKERVLKLEAEIQKNRIQHNQIKQLINARIFDKALLKRNIEQFYGGWLKHLSSAEHLKPKIAECEPVYTEFLKSVDEKHAPLQAPIINAVVWFVMFVFLMLGNTGKLWAMQSNKLNVVVILDLSDRLLVPGVFSADSAMVMAACNGFYNHVKNNLFIKSEDCFKIVTPPQQGTSQELKQLINQLQLNLANCNMAQRKQVVNDFKNSLPQKLQQLYKLAYRGNKTKNYPGTDIWQYVNEQLQTDLIKDCRNKILFITDGYLDFENDNHALKQNNLFTSTHFLDKLNNNNWKQQAINQKYGIMPVKHSWYNATVQVAGFYSKQQNNLTRIDMLRYFWKQWLFASGFNNVDLVNMAEPNKLYLLVFNFISNNN